MKYGPSTITSVSSFFFSFSFFYSNRLYLTFQYELHLFLIKSVMILLWPIFVKGADSFGAPSIIPPRGQNKKQSCSLGRWFYFCCKGSFARSVKIALSAKPFQD